jgi:hypothetical protein
MPQSTGCPAHLAACVELAGFAAAQAVCCLFDRVPFVPMAFARNGGDNVTVTLLRGGTPTQTSAAIRQWLDANVDGADVAAVVCDAFITVAGVKRDALVVEGRSYAPGADPVKIAVPYRAHHHPRGFAVHRPKFIVKSLDGHDVDALGRAFLIGVCAHEAGRRVWDACADESW